MSAPDKRAARALALQGLQCRTPGPIRAHDASLLLKNGVITREDFDAFEREDNRAERTPPKVSP